MPLDDKFYEEFEKADAMRQRRYLAKQPLEKQVAIQEGLKAWKEKQPGFLAQLFSMGTAEKPSLGQTALVSGQKGWLGGFADEAMGALNAIYPAEAPSPSGPSGTAGSNYRGMRDANRGIEELNEATNPKTAFVSEMGGGVLAPGATLGTVGKGASLGRKVLQGGAVAGGMGALSGLGHSDADLTTGQPENWVEAAQDTGIGAGAGVLLGAPLAAGGHYAGKLLRKTGDKAAEAASNQKFAASYPSVAASREISEERAGEIGRRFLNEGVGGPLSGVEDIARKTAAKRQALGEEIGAMDEHLSTLMGDDTLPADRIGYQIMEDAAEQYPLAATGDLREGMMAEGVKLADEYKKKPLRFKELRGEKSENWRKGYETQDFQPTRRAGMFRQTGRSEGKQYDQYAEMVDPEVAGQLKETGKRFADYAEGEEVAAMSAARARNKGTLTISDIGAVIGGTAAGGPLGGAASLGLKKTLETRGRSIAAHALNNIAKVAGGKGPSGEVARIMLKNPERLEKYLPALVEAAGRSEAALQAITEKLAGLPDF